MKKGILYILAAITFIVGCKKIESPLEQTANTDPIYKVEGKIDNEPFKMTMDNETVLMTYGEEDINGVTSFFTKFEDIPNAAALKLSIIAPVKIYRKITEYPVNDHQLPFLVHQEGCYDLGFDNPPANPPLIMVESNGHFENMESIAFKEFGIYDVPIRFKGINETYNLRINHGFSSPDWNAKFVLESGVNGISYSSNFPDGDHQWFLDDQAISQSSSGQLSFSVYQDGVHTLHHILTDSEGNKCNYDLIFFVQANNVKWIFETTECIPSSLHSNFEHIIINYEKNGEMYSSAFGTENTNIAFSLKNIAYFLENPSSNAVSVKFDATFDGTLYNEDKSKKLALSGVRGTFKYSIK